MEVEKNARTSWRDEGSDPDETQDESGKGDSTQRNHAGSTSKIHKGASVPEGLTQWMKKKKHMSKGRPKKRTAAPKIMTCRPTTIRKDRPKS